LYCQYKGLGVQQMIEVRLREAMERYSNRTGERMTYSILSERTGLSRSTLESIATRSDYNATLGAVDKICEALGCTLAELLERTGD
jgi:DNA-binding Xre family transcriptional regulator